MKKDLIIKITVPLLIIIALGGVKVIKDSTTTQPAINSETTQKSSNEVNSKTTTPSTTSSTVADASDSKKAKDFSAYGDDTTSIEELKQYGMPIFINFSTGTCPACKEFQPVMDKLSAEFYGKAIIKTINADKSPLITQQFPIKVVPTQVLINADGTPYVPGNDAPLGFLGYSKQNSNELGLTTHEGTLTEQEMREVLKRMGMK